MKLSTISELQYKTPDNSMDRANASGGVVTNSVNNLKPKTTKKSKVKPK